MDYTFILVLACSFILTFKTIPPIVKVSHLKHLFDEPNERKVNTTVVPNLGGVAIFIGFSIASFLFLPNEAFAQMKYVFAALTLVYYTGLKDDILIIVPFKKFLVQCLAAVIIVYMGDIRISNAYGAFGLTEVDYWLSSSFSVLFIIFIVNAVNLIDGIDGLAGFITLAITIPLAILFVIIDQIAYAVLSIAVIGAVIAFLYYNVFGKEFKIFMGDTGSLFLGLIVVVLYIQFQELNLINPSLNSIVQVPLFGLSLLIVPICDTVRVFSIRILNGRSPFSPDKMHFHHLLLNLGFSHVKASLFMFGYTILNATVIYFVDDKFNINVVTILLLIFNFSFIGGLFFLSRSKYIKANIEKLNVSAQV